MWTTANGRPIPSVQMCNGMSLNAAWWVLVWHDESECVSRGLHCYRRDHSRWYTYTISLSVPWDESQCQCAMTCLRQLLIAMDSQKEEEKMLQNSLESSGNQDGSQQVVFPCHQSQCAMAWASMPMMSLKCDMRSLTACVLPQQALVCCHDESQYAMVSKPVCHDES